MSERGNESAEVLRELRGTTYWIIINRAEKRNAMNAGVVAGIREGLREAHANAEVRAIVLTGLGDRAFCAGGDLQPGKGFTFDFSRPSVDYADLLREGQTATLPIVARVNGTCMAGGMGLLCLADLAVAADHAMFGLPEVKVGLFPMQVLSLLQDLVPRRVVREWALTGEPFTAQQALQVGLVNHLASPAELNDKTQWLVDRLVDKSPTAIRRGKYAMRAMAAMSFEQAIAYTESQIATMPMTEDAREGMAAFNEKRKAVWSGR